jgi:hypothetical protein
VIYRQLLGPEFDKLPAVLREFHSAPQGGHASGVARIRHTSSLLAWLVRFPPEGEMPITLDIDSTSAGEVWIRHFGDAERRSSQTVDDGLLCEVAGPLHLYFRVTADPTGIRFSLVRARCLSVPIPLRVTAVVSAAPDANDAFNAEVSVAGVGSYQARMRIRQ